MWELIHRKLKSKLKSKNQHEWHDEYAMYTKYPTTTTSSHSKILSKTSLMKNVSDFMEYFKRCTEKFQNESGPATVPIEVKVESSSLCNCRCFAQGY